jgi:membrane fusion protein (multidrug efflux system)
MKRILRASIFPLLLIGILAALILGKVVWGGKDAASQQRGGGASGRAVTVEVVKRTSVSETLELNGSLRGSESTELRSEISGRVSAIHFTDGQAVKAGDLLLKIDDRELSAELAAARTQLQLAKIKADRQTSLLERGLVSKAEYDEVISQRSVLNAQVSLLRARFIKTELRAPFDGRIGLREISPGALITQTARIATIQRMDPLHLDFSVPERYQAQVKPGMSVTLRVDGLDRAFSGTINAIEPRIDEDTRSLRLRAAVPNPDGALLPGNFARITLPLQEYADAILVPTTAVERGLNEAIVHVVDDEGLARRRVVTVGIRQVEHIQILSGLEVGERVVVRGASLSDGAPVRVVGSGAPVDGAVVP